MLHPLVSLGDILIFLILLVQGFENIGKALLTTFGLLSGQFSTDVINRAGNPALAGILAVVGVATFLWVRLPGQKSPKKSRHEVCFH